MENKNNLFNDSDLILISREATYDKNVIVEEKVVIHSKLISCDDLIVIDDDGEV